MYLHRSLDSPNDPLPSIERDTTPAAMDNAAAAAAAAVFTQEQMDTMIASAVDAAVAQALAQDRAARREATSVTPDPAATPGPGHTGRVSPGRLVANERSLRALTADLMPTEDYYLPVPQTGVRRIEPSKVRYPRIPFSDHKGEIEYDAWKMDMKLFIEEYYGNFTTGTEQIKAYFKCAAGEAKTIILQRMDPEFGGDFSSAKDVLKALDERFFDHNAVIAAKRKYHQLVQGALSYNEFRVKFTTYATTGKIARSRWFEDVCEKISPQLKRVIMTEKYKMSNQYSVLDEYLAVADREERNIRAEENRHTSFTLQSTDRGRGILKKVDWRDNAVPPVGTPVAPNAVRPAYSSTARSPSPAPTSVPASPSLAATSNCFTCGKIGHFSKDCPNAHAVNKKIAELSLEQDPLSGNS